MFSIELPKWPALVVVGPSVTPAQAREIIIRTDYALQHISTNDREWECELIAAMGLTYRDEWPHSSWQEQKALFQELGCLELGYLYNSRIATCYVDGPHGWIDWDGNIGCCTYNIGKWPTTEEVFEEWTRIAEAFPFLSLRSQLFNCEQCEVKEKNGVPVVEFVVGDGSVEIVEPSEPLANPYCLDVDWRTRSERGCTIEMFKEALDQVRSHV